MGDSEGFDFSAIFNTIGEMLSKWGIKVVGALALLIIGLIVLKKMRRSMVKSMKKSKLDEVLVTFFSGIVYYAMLAALMIAVLGLFGVETTSVIAVFGAAGLAVGLALQGALSNFAAGVMLLIFRPFRPGDYVEAAGVAGTISEVGVFSTRLNTPDNILITLPNSLVFGHTIKNYSANENRRNDMVVGISYTDDIGQAVETIQKVLDAEARVLKDPAPVIAVAELADSSVNLVVRPWCKSSDYWACRFDLMRKFKEELEGAGLSIPYPQTDVHLFNEDKNTA